jgi:SpoVK/Ycf46/Vps4 family AAA+-type ATPase
MDLCCGWTRQVLAQALLSLTIRQKLPFESAPLHGLLVLTGAPGTGKTTLARGLANQIAKQLPSTKTTFVEIDPHALMSSAHGRSQQAVAKLFEQTIPEFAVDGVAVVLIDEVETLAVSRQMGTLSLALRSLVDADPNRKTVTEEKDDNRNRLNMVRFGVTSTTVAK